MRLLDGVVRRHTGSPPPGAGAAERDLTACVLDLLLAGFGRERSEILTWLERGATRPYEPSRPESDIAHEMVAGLLIARHFSGGEA